MQTIRRHRFRILQPGSLPLRPDGSVQRRVEHRCTSLLIWPTDEPPTPDNCVITDPCFTVAGLAGAREQAEQAGIALEEIRQAFLTHDHLDHQPCFPDNRLMPLLGSIPEDSELPSGFHIVPCPGHSPELRALVFHDETGRAVWVVGDAVLDRDWLIHWGYYWPNGYEPSEIVQTWRSVARVLQADWIVPGHGEPIEVTRELLDLLIQHFSRAEYALDCPDVRTAIDGRRCVL